jgi:hypothetical protein
LVVILEVTNNLSQILQGEPEINADGVHEGSSSPQTEIVHGNVSVSTSREDSVIHHKNCIRESCKVSNLCNLRSSQFTKSFHNVNNFLIAELIEWRNC